MAEKISAELKNWEKNILNPVLKKFPERKENFKTSSGIDVKRLYTPEDLKEFDYIKDLGFPGTYPFTRGVQPTMYRGKLWTMRQYAGFGTAEESNERYRYLLSQGQTGLSVAFDLPTQIGYDSDHSLSEGEVGRVGVAIDSIEDMEILFKDIPLDKVSTSMTINSTAAIILAMYVVVAEKQGISPDKLRGTIQNDILKEYIARGTYIYPPKPSMRIITDIFSYCSKNMPKFNPISISGYHVREAGANAVQEVAFTLADAIAYVETAISAGLDPNVFGSRLSFFFAAHNNFFEEIAKFRAARRLWAKIMKEKFKVSSEKAMRLRFHTQTGGSTLTAQQPLNNIVRVALQALAAVLGGTQSLHTNSFDEAIALPSKESVTTALRTQQIIAYESGVADTVDPLAGSYYIESLTKEIEEKALEYIKKIEELGGMIEAIEDGYIQNEIAENSYKQQLMVEKGETVVVGVNKFGTQEDYIPKNILKVNPELEERQKRRLKNLKQRRDNRKVKECIEKVKRTALGGGNLMYPIIEAVRNYATVGEISDALREVFGEYKEKLTI